MTMDIGIMHMAAAMASHASARQSVIAGNVAHADTPGYKARDIAVFAETYEQVPLGFDARASRSKHLSAEIGVSGHPTPLSQDTGNESPNGNNVSLEAEMTKAATVKRDHDLALGIYKKSLDILRLSLGKGR